VKLLSHDDLLDIPQTELPLLVLTDNLRSWWSWRIKRHTGGYYNHVMWMHRPGLVVSQDRRLRARPITDYLRGNHRIKLWTGCWTPATRCVMQQRIAFQLALTERRYDWVGIIGQRLGLPWLNCPGRFYCSEHAATILRLAEPFFVNRHPTPADIDAWCKTQPQMVVYGLHDPSL